MVMDNTVLITDYDLLLPTDKARKKNTLNGYGYHSINYRLWWKVLYVVCLLSLLHLFPLGPDEHE